MTEASPEDVTRLLELVGQGRLDAQELLRVVYAQLRTMAAVHLSRESPGHTLQPTALVNEAYIRLLGPNHEHVTWQSRAHYFGAAAEAMRRILIDHARAKRAAKRGGPSGRARHPHALTNLTLDAAVLNFDTDPGILCDLDEALESLEARDPHKARLVKLRFFAGMTLEQAARVLDVSPATADRHWSFAKAWLFARLSSGHEKSADP